MVVSEGKPHLVDFLKGLLLSILSVIGITYISPYITIESQPLLSAFIIGFTIAFFQRILITFTVMGKEYARAAWLGYGFGIIEAIAILIPGLPHYTIIIAGGSTLYHLYRRALNSLFQSASAMILSRATIPKIFGLILIQGFGTGLLIAHNTGLLEPYLQQVHITWTTLFSLPIIHLFIEKNN